RQKARTKSSPFCRAEASVVSEDVRSWRSLRRGSTRTWRWRLVERVGKMSSQDLRRGVHRWGGMGMRRLWMGTAVSWGKDGFIVQNMVGQRGERGCQDRTHCLC